MAMNPRLLRPILSGDPDALRYITAVQKADGSTLELAVRKAITDFVVGCKADGIWSAIKACCLLAGPRTLAGINVPLVGPTPTFNAFTSGQYNRETGLAGNASTMHIDSGRNNNADGQNNHHLAVYVGSFSAGTQALIGGGAGGDVGASCIGTWTPSGTAFFHQSRNSAGDNTNFTSVAGFVGMSRDASASYMFRANGSTASINRTSQTPFNAATLVYARLTGGAPQLRSGSRLAFYSIGEALDLSLLDTRISAYITAIAAAI